MLVVVLLSAAPINGQPRTRLVGSAFDPASVSVVVRPSKTRQLLASPSLEKSKLPDTEPDGTPLFAVVESLELPDRRPAGVEPRPDTVSPSTFEPRRLWRAHRSRAPPAA